GLGRPPIPLFWQWSCLTFEQNPRSGALQIVILAVFQRPHKGRKSYQAEPDRDRNEKEEVDHSAAFTANSRASWCAGSPSPRPSRSACATTMTDDSDIATAATSGVTSPSAPSGIATRLYATASVKFCRTSRAARRATTTAWGTARRLSRKNTRSAAL